MVLENEKLLKMVGEIKEGNNATFETLAEMYKDTLLGSASLLADPADPDKFTDAFIAATSAFQTVVIEFSGTTVDEFNLELNIKMPAYAAEAYDAVRSYQSKTMGELKELAEAGDEVAAAVLASAGLKAQLHHQEEAPSKIVVQGQKVVQKARDTFNALKPTLPEVKGDGAMTIKLPVSLTNKK